MKRSTIALLIILVFLLICVIVGCCFRGAETPEIRKPVEADKSIVQTFYEQRDVWDDLAEDASGSYQTGYYFVDINLDGVKDLGVQYGGDNSNNCIAKFYEVKKGTVTPISGFDPNYSIAFANLERYQDNNQQYYMNRYMLVSGDGEEFNIYYDKILPNCVVEPFLGTKDVYQDNQLVSRDYFVNGQKVESTEYDKTSLAFADSVTKADSTIYFVPYSGWKDMTEEERIATLNRAYNISNDNYADILKDELVKPIDVSHYEIINTTLSDAVYGKELLDFQEMVGGDVSAQVVTDKKSFVYIMPAADSLDNMIFYYQDARPVAYVREFNGIGGSVTYYFLNSMLHSIDKSNIEPEMDFQQEDDISVVIKAESAWGEFASR